MTEEDSIDSSTISMESELAPGFDSIKRNMNLSKKKMNYGIKIVQPDSDSDSEEPDTSYVRRKQMIGKTP